jgi:DNA-binding XRE family transcriptional regulator
MNGLQAERQKRGLSVADFSKATGISEKTIRHIEDPLDTHKVHVDTAVCLAKFLNLPVEELFPDSSELTTIGNTQRQPTGEPKQYPTCDKCYLEIPPAFRECPMCN